MSRDILLLVSDVSGNRSLRGIYARFPSRYERVNHLLTWGMDMIWRRELVRRSACAGRGIWLDVCTGTGETALGLRDRAGGVTRVIGLDYSLPMLRRLAGREQGIACILGDAGWIPVRDGGCDLVTISFATRNLDSVPGLLDRSLWEFRRILKPGGVLLHLETSQPEVRWIRRLFHLYARGVVSPAGGWLSGSPEGFRYLARSMIRHEDAESFSRRLQAAGFRSVEYRRLFLGVAAVHAAWV